MYRSWSQPSQPDSTDFSVLDWLRNVMTDQCFLLMFAWDPYIVPAIFLWSAPRFDFLRLIKQCVGSCIAFFQVSTAQVLDHLKQLVKAGDGALYHGFIPNYKHSISTVLPLRTWNMAEYVYSQANSGRSNFRVLHWFKVVFFALFNYHYSSLASPIATVL